METRKFDEWAVVDQYGHTRLAGRVTEATIAGGSFIRLDIPGKDGQIAMTKFLGPGSIFEFTLVTEETAKAFAATHIPAPVTRWDLPQNQIELRSHRSDSQDDPDV